MPVGANRDTSVVAIKSAVDAFADAVKAGRVLSAKNQETLESVVGTLDGAVSSLKNVLSQVAAGEDPDPRPAEQEPTNDEEPAREKSDESAARKAARALAVTRYALSL